MILNQDKFEQSIINNKRIVRYFDCPINEKFCYSYSYDGCDINVCQFYKAVALIIPLPTPYTPECLYDNFKLKEVTMSGVLELNGKIAKDEAEKIIAAANNPKLTEEYRQCIEKEGYKDEYCPKCGVLYLACEHFIRCDHAANGEGCPMHDGKPSVLHQILGLGD